MRIPLVAATLLIGGSAWAAPRQAYVLRYNLTPGTMGRYKATVAVTMAQAGQKSAMGGMGINGGGNVTLTILGRRSADSANARADMENFQMSGLGRNRAGGSETTTFVLSATGRVSGTKPTKDAASASPLGPFARPDVVGTAITQLPRQPVSVGDKWQAQRASLVNQAKPVAVSTRFAALETVAGKRTARLTQSFAFPVDMTFRSPQQQRMRMTGKLVVTGYTNFAIKEGKTVRSHYSGGGLITIVTPADDPKNAMKLKLNVRLVTDMKLVP